MGLNLSLVHQKTPFYADLERQKLYRKLRKMIKNIEKGLGKDAELKIRLRAYNVISFLIKESVVLLRDVEIEDLVTKITALERKAEKTGTGRTTETEAASTAQ